MEIQTSRDIKVTKNLTGDAHFSILEKVIDSIIQISAYEIEELKHNRAFDIATTSMRKARLLLDFNAASKEIVADDLPDAIKIQLKSMQAMLRRSVRQYQFHASAIREVATLIMDATQAQQGDGTYTMRKLR